MKKCGICGKETDDLIITSIDFIPTCKDCCNPFIAATFDDWEEESSCVCLVCGNEEIKPEHNFCKICGTKIR